MKKLFYSSLMIGCIGLTFLSLKEQKNQTVSKFSKQKFQEIKPALKQFRSVASEKIVQWGKEINKGKN